MNDETIKIAGRDRRIMTALLPDEFVRFIINPAKDGFVNFPFSEELPKDAAVAGVYFDYRRRCFEVIFEHPSFPVTPVGSEPPRLEIEWAMRRHWAGNFQAEQWEWVKKTFPDELPGGVLNHLEEEIRELKENPGDAEELADCFLLIQCLASHHGVNLMEAARSKFAKCKTRTWENVPGKGYRHVKEENQSQATATLKTVITRLLPDVPEMIACDRDGICHPTVGLLPRMECKEVDIFVREEEFPNRKVPELDGSQDFIKNGYIWGIVSWRPFYGGKKVTLIAVPQII